MGKKYFDWLVITWIVGSIIGIIALIISVVFCDANPRSEYALFLGRIIGPVDFGYIIALPLGFFIVWTVIMVIIRNLSNKIKNQSTTNTIAQTPASIIPAKVVLKNSATTSHRPSIQDYVYVYDTFSITFEATDGRRLVFPVTQEQYSMYLEGDTGILTYKENQGHLIFINFERQMQPSN